MTKVQLRLLHSLLRTALASCGCELHVCFVQAADHPEGVGSRRHKLDNPDQLAFPKFPHTHARSA